MSRELHILVVDDRPDSVLFLTEFLNARHHRVESASSGGEALDAIVRRQRTKEAYDLVISDVSMPGLDGVALLKELRRRGSIIPVALYTAYGAMHPNLAREAANLNCIAILDKPLELRRIDSLLHDVAARRDRTTPSSGHPHVSTTRVGTKRIGTERHETKDEPFFGTSRVARPATDTIRRNTTDTNRRETAFPSEMRDERSAGYALEPRAPSPLPMPVPNPSLQPPAPVAPPTLRPPLPFPADIPDPQTRSMPSFRTPLPQESQQQCAVDRPVNPKFRTPLPFLQSNNAMSTDKQTNNPESLPTASPIRQPPAEKPATTIVRRGIHPAPEKHTDSFGRGTASFTADSALPSGSGTARIRRTITGSFTANQNPEPAPAAGATRAVACASCNKVFMVAVRPTSYTSVCIHCGQMNRIDPQ